MQKRSMLFFIVSIFITSISMQTVTAQSWNLAGNADANAASKLGTTNNVSLRFYTNNVQRMIINSAAGFVGIGTPTPVNILTVQQGGGTPAASWLDGLNSPIYMGFAEGVSSEFVLAAANALPTRRAVIQGRRSRGTLAAPTAVVNNDFITSVLASAHDGTSFQNPATIDFFVDGVPSAGNVPARISFVTGSNVGNRLERLKVGSTGNFNFNDTQMFLQQSTGYLGIGTITPAVTLDVNSPNGFLARFNGGANMFMGLYESGIYRGYLGSYSGAAADVDFGTGVGNAAGKVHLTIQATPKLTVDAMGQVGIGTTAPTAALHVINNSVNQALSIISSTANGQIANIQTTTALNTNNDLLQLDLPAGQGAGSQFIEASIANSTRFAVNSDGIVGIGGTALAGTGLYVRTGGDAAPASGGYIVSGLTTAENIAIDNNEIMARNNGAISTLFLQNNGGILAACANAGNVTIGTTTPATGYKLSVNGRIIATEVRVELVGNWPDYVFKKGYKLMPIEQLEAKINADKHLPGIPSANEMKENGIMLGEMQTKTIEKVEENTLYIIELNKKIKLLEEKKVEENIELNKKIKLLEEKIEELIKKNK